MIALEVTWHGLKGLRGAFEKALEKLRHTHEQNARIIINLYAEAAKRWAPRGEYFDRYGSPMEPKHERLWKSIRVGSVTTLPGKLGIPGGIKATVQMAPFGEFTLRPVAPHLILPSNRQALAFFWKDAPEEVKIRWGRPATATGAFVILPQGVLHPGYTPPYRWDQKAWEEIAPWVSEMLGKSIEEWGATIKAASDTAAEMTFKA